MKIPDEAGRQAEKPTTDDAEHFTRDSESRPPEKTGWEWSERFRHGVSPSMALRARRRRNRGG